MVERLPGREDHQVNEVTFKLSNPDGLTLEDVQAFVDQALEQSAAWDSPVWVTVGPGQYGLSVDVPAPHQDALL